MISCYRQSNETITESTPSRGRKRRREQGNSDETEERTDEESSYSSFYSSFFKTDTGSVEDSSDGKKENPKVRTFFLLFTFIKQKQTQL